MLNPFSLSLSLSLSHSPQNPSPSLSFVQNLSFFLWSFLAPNQFSLLQSLPICLLSLMVPPIYHSKHQIPSLYIGATSFKPLSFRRSHPPPTLSLLRTTPPNPSFYGNPCVMKMIIFAVILVMKTKKILFTVISMTKTDGRHYFTNFLLFSWYYFFPSFLSFFFLNQKLPPPSTKISSWLKPKKHEKPKQSYTKTKYQYPKFSLKH